MNEQRRVIDAHEFRLLDIDDSPIARLGRNQNGSFGLSIGRTADSTAPIISVNVAPAGEPVIAIADRQGNPRLMIDLNQNGDCRLAIFDLTGNNRFNITVTADGNATVYQPE